MLDGKVRSGNGFQIVQDQEVVFATHVPTLATSRNPVATVPIAPIPTP